ncbi:hypothetical protein Hdeb2414_s0026g00674641 [Helianthus debilis subsp. tardiflorus]
MITPLLLRLTRTDIIAISALLAVEVSSAILFFTKIPSKCYAILKFFAIFSASISPFLLLMVLDVSPSFLCLLGYVFGGIVIADACSGDDDADKNLDKRSPVAIFTYSGLFLIPLSLVLVLFVPVNLDWIVYSVIYPIFGVEMICFFIIYFKFTIMSLYEKPKAQNLEAHQGIHQDKNRNGLEAQQVVQQDKNNNDSEAQQDKKQSSVTL